MDVSIYRPVIIGVAIAVYLSASTDLTAKDFKWWVAMMALNVMCNT